MPPGALLLQRRVRSVGQARWQRLHDGVHLHRRRPGTGFGANPPVSRFCRSHRSILGTDTANIAATSSRGVPIATARTTRSRRSSEYGFMLQA